MILWIWRKVIGLYISIKKDNYDYVPLGAISNRYTSSIKYKVRKFVFLKHWGYTGESRQVKVS